MQESVQVVKLEITKRTMEGMFHSRIRHHGKDEQKGWQLPNK
jgi:hypothetical protein